MTIQNYVGTSSLDYQIANTLQLCSIKNPVKLSELKKEACEALGLDFGKSGSKPPEWNLAVFEWLRDNKTNSLMTLAEPTAMPIPELVVDIEPAPQTELMIVDSSIIAEINREHELAQQASKTAVEHGSRAGALLLQVKESLPHGEFGAWLVENVTVSERQAQRYMRHAKGLPVLRTISKSDTVSVLNNDAESIAKIVAETVAQQMAIERAKMVAEFEREKELAELAKGINADYESFKQNRDGLINDLIEMKALHVGAYWNQLVDIHSTNKIIAELLFDDDLKDDMNENEARVMTDVVHASLVAQIAYVELLRNHKDWTELEFKSFDDFIEKNSIDLDHFERYKQMPIYSEIVASIEAFKLAIAETTKPRDIAINAACESVVKCTPTLALAGAMVANQ
jgi:hypothetical protein